MVATLRELVALVQSDKSKDRAQGIAELKTHFQHEQSVQSLNDSDGKAWLVVYQALFKGVAAEFQVCTKKGLGNATTTALNRLSMMADVVRWLTQRTVSKLVNKVIKPLLSHLLQTLVYHGELLEPVAFHYLQCLRLILSYSPHLEHLDPNVWMRMLSNSFAILLDQPLTNSITLDEDEENEVEDLTAEMGDSEAAEVSDASTETPRKRRRRPSRTSRPLPARATRSSSSSLSKEQIVASQLINLLLHSPFAIFNHEDHPNLTPAILNRLSRFFEVYPSETSAHLDISLATVATLSRIEHNSQNDIVKFSINIWGSLLSLWPTKNKAIKESLTAIFTILLPFLSLRDKGPIKPIDDILRLTRTLEADMDGRTGIEELSLDSLRLDFTRPSSKQVAFCGSTFRASRQISPSQALSWTMLILRADCIASAARYHERASSSTPQGASRSKRARLEHPVLSLLSSALSSSSSGSRGCHLQVLLFVIDRHPELLNGDLRSQLVSTLLSLQSLDDSTIQSWSFVCMAALLWAGPNTPPPEVKIDWDPVWSYALRRAATVAVSRAACHFMRTIMLSSSNNISHQRFLTDLEALARELEIQGPPFPYDSVCGFLREAIKFASKDVRLFRMQFEDKIVRWLVDNWNVSEGVSSSRIRMDAHEIGDVLELLCACLTMSRTPQIYPISMLSDCPISHFVLDYGSSQVIRDYMLNAKLPVFQPVSQGESSSPGQQSGPGQLLGGTTEPSGRERRVSAFLQKSLDLLITGWESGKDIVASAHYLRVCRTLDFAILSIMHNGALSLNGLKPNAAVIQSACKAISLMVPCIAIKRWTTEERAMVLSSLYPLIAYDEDIRDDQWTAMILPRKETGIQHRILFDMIKPPSQTTNVTRLLLEAVWKLPDVKSCFSNVLPALRETLRQIAKVPPEFALLYQEGSFDTDEFGSVRTSETGESERLGLQVSGHRSMVLQLSTMICVKFLTDAPLLQEPNTDGTRDKLLCDTVVGSNGPAFLILAPAFFRAIRRRSMYLSFEDIENLYDRIEDFLKSYTFSRSESMQLLAIELVDSISYVWMDPAHAMGDPGNRMRALVHWLAKLLSGGNMKSWRSRDRLVRFMDRYIGLDPSEHVWCMIAPDDDDDVDEGVEGTRPSNVLPPLSDDEDTRVRFRAATACARLLCNANELGELPMKLYDRIRKLLPKDLDQTEHMLTRTLFLGNIMVANSAVRRGPYWHLLETCLYVDVLTRHIEAVLQAVAERMGLTSINGLCQAYKYQIAYSVNNANKDFFQLPCHLLGFTDTKQAAQSMFNTLGPILIVSRGMGTSEAAVSYKRFLALCRHVDESELQGLRRCFPELIAHQIMLGLHNLSTEESQTPDLQDYLEALTTPVAERVEQCSPEGQKTVYLKNHLDGIVASLLRMVQDMDYSKDGPICQTLATCPNPEQIVQTFTALNRHRSSTDFPMHPPNVPSFSTALVLQSLSVLKTLHSDVLTPSTVYHVIHLLFSDIGDTPLVNEQLRYLHSLSVWIALNWSEFSRPTLLRALLRGAVGLLKEIDLAHAAQSIVSWVFDKYRELGVHDALLKSMITRSNQIVLAHSQRRDDPVSLALSTELGAWIDTEVVKFSEHVAFRSAVHELLAGWPRALSEEQNRALVPAEQRSNLLKILGDVDMRTIKFSLARHLESLFDNPSVKDYFLHQGFWTLKDAIPDPARLQETDLDAFTNLLFECAGRVEPYTPPKTPNHVALRHQDISRSRKNDFKAPSPKGSCVSVLFRKLSADSSSEVHRAYLALRRLYSLDDEDLSGTSIPREFREEAEALADGHILLLEGADRVLSELRTSKIYLEAASDFPTWISSLTTFLAEFYAKLDPFYVQLIPIFQTDIDYAGQMLPVLIHQILYQTRKTQAMVGTLISQYLTDVLSQQNVHVDCIQAIVEVCQHLRNFTPDGTSSPLSYDTWLEIDYILLSRSAVACGAYTTALLFLELAGEDGSIKHFSDNAIVEEILYSIYSHIDEPDGFYGIRSSSTQSSLARRFQHEHQWDKAYRLAGSQFEARSSNSQSFSNLLKSMHAYGFNRQAMMALDSARSEEHTIDEINQSLGYCLAWRTETWDLPDSSTSIFKDADLYRALRAVHRERDPSVALQVVRTTMTTELMHLRDIGPENMSELQESIQSLICLGEVKSWLTDLRPRLIQPRVEDSDQWTGLHRISDNFEFQTLENIFATRMVLLHSVTQQEQRQQLGNLESSFLTFLKSLEIKCLLKVSEAARVSEEFQIAMNSTVRAQSLEKVPSPATLEEFAHVLWSQKEQKTAIEYLNSLSRIQGREETSLGSPFTSGDPTRRALLLARQGQWISEARLEKPTDIRQHYFEPAVELLGKADAAKIATVCQQYALFAQNQYQSILRSPEVARLHIYMERKKDELRRIDEWSSGNSTRTDYLSQHKRRAEILLEEDSARAQEHRMARDQFLIQAMDMFAQSLAKSDAYDTDSAIRFISLWFSNFGVPHFEDAIRRAVTLVPSRKFIFLAHQLTARLSEPTSGDVDSAQTLYNLVSRLADEHPFHVLYQLFALRQGSKGEERASSSRTRRSSVIEPQASQVARKNAAKTIFNKARENKRRGDRVKQFERLCNACLEWAKYPLKTARNAPRKKADVDPAVPIGLDIAKIRDLNVPVSTIDLPIDPSMRYDNIVSIKRYSESYTTAGGVNLPKISTCIGSDGQRYKQLFKGEGDDDLRQDAVMEQVFQLCNILLKRDRGTSKRRLGIRTYKVIPLAEQAGILEFVSNTTPLFAWLQNAHPKYRPKDLSLAVAKERIKAAQDRSSPTDTTPAVAEFLKIREEFKPVMRHFFTEKHKEPMAWFAMRLNYARSVATTSIVGHILGLGDRHVSNILMDNVSGEVVHIDLGIAFDQGRLLKVPEKVPFRLTADMVDGLGHTGPEGVFRRCSEQTLRVLRSGSGVIQTVLEVFKYDPLHSWTANPVKLLRMQPGTLDPSGPAPVGGVHGIIDLDIDSDPVDESADRALSSVERKLSGSLSVEYTVNELILAAMDVANLAMIFHGMSFPSCVLR
ncbi:hypothetical protein SISNIDRAFT_518835 [Sistotremastrum niveocremeum HHB9708]|uniref:Serine/threonine-protein kinase Tel1 n=1 Tax=Sistotremastrum niveocremeum HHB9708 TaxID=1314777 RepID=A0A164RPD3_9AGAM|nr:hypothetical protein SISNIDRAFT_518835 [Sistotremastrum niveocremeum HHB9708]